MEKEKEVKHIETSRCLLRAATQADAAFIVELVNSPGWRMYIGKSKIQTKTQAKKYIQNKLIGMYQTHGFGLYVVQSNMTGDPMGLCGLVKRDTLPHPDLGFAFLPQYLKQGYGCETAQAVINHTCDESETLLAITNQDNVASIGLLSKLDFKFERIMEDGLALYALNR